MPVRRCPFSYQQLLQQSTQVSQHWHMVPQLAWICPYNMGKFSSKCEYELPNTRNTDIGSLKTKMNWVSHCLHCNSWCQHYKSMDSAMKTHTISSWTDLFSAFQPLSSSDRLESALVLPNHKFDHRDQMWKCLLIWNWMIESSYCYPLMSTFRSFCCIASNCSWKHTNGCQWLRLLAILQQLERKLLENRGNFDTNSSRDHSRCLLWVWLRVLSFCCFS